jgi:hypothetical protein
MFVNRQIYTKLSENEIYCFMLSYSLVIIDFYFSLLKTGRLEMINSDFVFEKNILNSINYIEFNNYIYNTV